jgi:Flp pilus assembly protein TadD
VSGLFTALVERKLIGAEGADFALSVFDRVVLAGRVFWFYLGKLVWPADLTFIYPRWTVDSTQPWQWTFTIAALALVAVLIGWSRRSRAPLAATLIFGGTLFPVLGFVNVFPFIFSYVADHFQYLASLAVFAVVASGATRLSSRLPSFLRVSAAVVIVALLAWSSRQQSSNYRDVFTLYETTLAKNPACWMARNNLATALAEVGRVNEAIPHVEEALRLRPNFPEALNNLGDDWIQLQQPEKAMPLLEKALQLQPTYAVAHRNLGRALAMKDRTAEAIPHFIEAARLNPADPEAQLNWGIALMLSGDFASGLPHFERACELDPTPNAHLMFGRALLEQRRPADAATHFRAALAIDPQSTEAQQNLAQALQVVR